MASSIRCIELEKLKQNVQFKFDRIREALNVREKLLLRQIDVISASQMHKNVTTSSPPPPPSRSLSPTAVAAAAAPFSIITDETEFICENEEELIGLIRTFGKFNLDNINMALQDLYANEDYISPAIDHETMYKCLENIQSMTTIDNDTNANNENEEKIIVDFSSNRKLFRDNVTNINESIINITLNEAKELIKKSKPSIPLMSLNLNLSNDTNPTETIIDYQNNINCDSINSNKNSKDCAKDENQSKCKSSQTDLKEKIKIKPKITINNCNGTINLKNISNLTINCATEGSFSVPNDEQNVDRSSTNTESKQNDETPAYSRSDENDNDDDGNSCTNNSSMKDNENNSVNCEFYNRLLNEIKNSLKQKTSTMPDNAHYQQFHKTQIPQSESSTVSPDTNNGSNFTTTNDSTSCNANKKYILKNFENLKIIMENTTDNSADAHPVQIEQWLTEIISETEIEPMQNTEILEHSRINNELC